MTNLALTISNHGVMLGGGEYSYLDLLCNLPANWKPVAVVPHEGELKERLQKKGIETHVVALSAIRPWRLIQSLTTLRDFLRLCRRRRPSLIYANGSRAAVYGVTVGRILGIPAIWHCRIAQRDYWLDSLLCILSSRVITNSQATAKRFPAWFRGKIMVVYNGVDIQWLQANKVQLPNLVEDEWKIILTVARVSKWKRHDLVLSAFEQVAKSDQNVHLVCLGARDISEPEWWTYLQEKSLKSSFSNRIHWVGQVEDVRPYYRGAEMVVLASEHEPFGRVIVEAMACGVPVIATRSGGVPEIIRHDLDGILVSPGNYQQMADAMTRILNDNSLKDRLIQSAVARAEFFSLDSHARKMAQIFEDTINPTKLRMGT